ncbi:MAG: GspE/PulE family protein, partial [Terriglobia bacterium]
NLDIAEKRVPQDGRIKTDVGGGEVDLRVSTFPAVYGEKIVMRVLDKSSLALKLTDVGFSEENMAVFAGAIKRPSGLVLVTGPTGSGKTTTLYSALNEVVSPEKNVITLEDPVEYELDDINQGQINVKAGLTFATGLRSILRQDPDIIMVGEVRDLETASLVIRAALTGHLVFSTLHTMDAAATVTRLIDIGLEPFLISSSLAAVVAQRLARRTCPKCRTDYSPPTKTLSTVGVDVGGIKFQRGKGCKHCSLTGYKGRIALLEVVSITGPVKDLVCSGASVREIRSQFREEGFKSLVEDGIKKALDGVTTLEEVLRVAQTED